MFNQLDSSPVPQSGSAPASLPAVFTGTLHIHVAFDWGEEIDLEKAKRLIPAETHELPRRRRTPSSFAYRPAPLRIRLTPPQLDMPELGQVAASGEVTVFDFAGVSVGLHIPFRLSPKALLQLAGWLAEPMPLIQGARVALEPVHRQLFPAIQNPAWKDDQSEEYFVFQLAPGDLPPLSSLLCETLASWFAGLLRLEPNPLSEAEVAEAWRLRISYGPDDLFIPDWAAAVLVDEDCDETLQAIEFANLQLLEYRHIDNQLDTRLAVAYKVIHDLVKTWLPFWRSHARSLRALGELKVEANSLFERTGNVLKLVGDQYLARVYRLLSSRFHLEEWEENIRRKLEVVEGVYQVVSDQTDTYRTEFLEIVVIFLILLEIILALVRH
jgi:hypothetical protein